MQTDPVEPDPGTTVPSGDDLDSLIGTGTFAVQPSSATGPGGRDYFIYTLRPGQEFGDIVGISNLGTERATYAVYTTDAFNTPDGGFALLREEERPVGVGTWVELGATQYTLEPGERVDIPFRIEVPADAAPGDHAGAIVAQRIPEDPRDSEDGISFDVRLRIGARIYVRVDGPLVPSLTVESFDIDYPTPGNPFGSRTASVTYTVTNTGNIRLQASADLDVAGIFGLGRRTVPTRELPELLPGSSIDIVEMVEGVRPLIRLDATLTLEERINGRLTSRSISVWAIPWAGLIVLFVVVVGLVVALIARSRRRSRGRAPS